MAALLDHILAALSLPVVGSILIVAEIVLRAIPSAKALSLIIAAGAILEKVGAICSKLGEIVKKLGSVGPQNIQ